jgi:hypothetical protein
MITAEHIVKLLRGSETHKKLKMLYKEYSRIGSDKKAVMKRIAQVLKRGLSGLEDSLVKDHLFVGWIHRIEEVLTEIS